MTVSDPDGPELIIVSFIFSITLVYEYSMFAVRLYTSADTQNLAPARPTTVTPTAANSSVPLVYY